MKRNRLAAWAAAPLLLAAHTSGNAAESVTITGEVIDTWCYFSGVMGGTDAVVGSAHHTCSLWCSAGGIPAGLLAEDGTVYIVLSFEDEDPVDSLKLLDVQSHELTVEGTAYQRDGLHYIQVSDVVNDAGITNLNHEDFGPVPGFAIPELN